MIKVDGICIGCAKPICWLSGTSRFCGDCFEKTSSAERAELTDSQRLSFRFGDYFEQKSAWEKWRDQKKNSTKHSSSEEKRSSSS